MTATAKILASLETIYFETVQMLTAVDEAQQAPPTDRREAKRRVLEIRSKAQELSDWLSEVWLEEPRN